MLKILSVLATVGFSHASLAITCATVVRIGDSGGDGPSTAREVLPNHEIYKTENRLYLLSESDEGVLMITGLKLPFGSLAENRFGAPYFAGAAGSRETVTLIDYEGKTMVHCKR